MTEISLSRYLDDIQGMLARNSLEEAVAHSQHILKYYPRNATAYRHLGQGLAGLGRWDDATAVFRRLLGAYPNDFTAHYQLSIGFEKLTQTDRAIWHLERSFELQPNNHQVIENLRRLYKEHRGIDLQKVQLSTGAVATGYLDSALYEDAVKSLTQALQQNPDRTDLKLQLARALWALNQRVDAAEMALDVLEKLPFAVPANRILTELWLHEERPSDAQRYLSRIETVDPYLAMRVATGNPPLPDSFRLPELDYALYTSRALSKAAPDWLSSVGDESGAEAPPVDRALDNAFSEEDAASFDAATESADDLFGDIEGIGDEFSLDDFDAFDDADESVDDEFSLDDFDDDIITHSTAESVPGEEAVFDFDDALFDPDTDFPFIDESPDDKPVSKTDTGSVTRIEINPQDGVIAEDDLPDDVRARIDAMEGIAASETVAATAPTEFVDEDLDHILQAEEQGWLEELQDDLTDDDAPVAGRTGLTGLLSTLSVPEETIEADDDAWLTELASGQFNAFDDDEAAAEEIVEDAPDDFFADFGDTSDTVDDDLDNFFADVSDTSEEDSEDAPVNDFFADVDAIDAERQRSPSSPLRERASTGFTDEFNVDAESDLLDDDFAFEDDDFEDDAADENIPTTDAADPLAWMNASGIELSDEEDSAFEDAFFDDGGDVSIEAATSPDAWMQQSGIEFDVADDEFDFDDDDLEEDADPLAWMNETGAELLEDDFEDDANTPSASLYAPDMLVDDTPEDAIEAVADELTQDELEEFLEFESFMDDDFDDELDDFNDFDELEKFVLPDSDPVPDYPVAQDREVMPSEMLPDDDLSADMILDDADAFDLEDDILDDEISEMSWSSDILDESMLDDINDDDDENESDPLAWMNDAGAELVDDDGTDDDTGIPKFFTDDLDEDSGETASDAADESMPDFFSDMTVDESILANRQMPDDVDDFDEDTSDDDLLLFDDNDDDDDLLWLEDDDALAMDDTPLPKTDDLPSNERDVLGWLEDDLLLEDDSDSADDAISEDEEEDALAWLSEAGAELLEEGDGNADTGYDSGEDDVVVIDNDEENISSESAPRRSMLDWMVAPGTDDLKSTDELIDEQFGTTEENEPMLEDTFLPEDENDNDDWLSDLDDGGDEPDWWDNEMDDFVDDDFTASTADDADDADADWLSELSLDDADDTIGSEDDFAEDDSLSDDADWLSELSLDDADADSAGDNADALLAAGAAAGAGLAAAWVADQGDDSDAATAEDAEADWLNEFSLEDEDALEITADEADEHPEWLTDTVADDGDNTDDWLGELDFDEDELEIDMGDDDLLTLEDAGMDWLDESPVEELPELTDETDFVAESVADESGEGDSDLNWMELMSDPDYGASPDAIAENAGDIVDEDGLDWSLEPEGDELVADETNWLDELDLASENIEDEADDMVAEATDADWLGELDLEADDDIAETAPESAIPDWLGSIDDGEEDDVFAAAAIGDDTDDADAEGDWLDDLGFEEEVAVVEAVQSDSPEIDWLDDLDPDNEITENDVLSTTTAVDADWLNDLDFDEDEATEDDLIVADADWLADIDAEDGDLEEAFPLAESSTSNDFDAIEDDAFVMFGDEDDAFGFGDDQADGIMDAENEDSVYTEDEAEFDPAPADNAPDWLNAMVPGLDVDYDAPEDAPVEATYAESSTHRNREDTPVDASTLENFAWVQDIAENEEVAFDDFMDDDEADDAPFIPAAPFTFSRLPVWVRNRGDSGTADNLEVAPAAAVAVPDYLDFSDDGLDDIIDTDREDDFDDFMNDLTDDNLDDFDDISDDANDSFDDFIDNLAEDDFSDSNEIVESSGEDDFDFDDDIDDFDDGFDDFDFDDLD